MQPILNIPENIILKNRAGITELVKLYQNNDWDELEDTPVTFNYQDEPVSYFYDDFWDLSAYVDQRITHKSKFSFKGLAEQALVKEFKFVCFCWLYAAGNARISKPAKPTTLIQRASKLMLVYKYLDKKKFTSISSLNHPILMTEFCEYLGDCSYSLGQLSQVFNCLVLVEKMNDYLPFQFSLAFDESLQNVSKKYASPEKLKADQFYAIPTKLMQKLYSHIIELVEFYHPHKELLHNLLKDLRKNYKLGKKSVDDKIATGKWKWITADSSDYRIEVNKHIPIPYSDLISAYIENTPLEKKLLHKITVLEGKITMIKVACIMVCAAYTGMRRSELFSLHGNSFIKKEINNKQFCYLTSVMHKMTQGKGVQTAWITSPVTKLAIELAEALNRHLSDQLCIHDNPSKQMTSTCLMLTQSIKSRAPTVQMQGNHRDNFRKIAKDAGLYITQEDLDEFKLLNPNCNLGAAAQKIQVGKLWPITMHQFRRTFAVFAKRYNLCSDVAIKQQFKHIHLPMSEWYGEGGIAARLQGISVDDDLKSLLDDVSCEVNTQTLYNWYHNNEKLYGKMGKAISKERKYVANHYTSWEALKKQIDKGLLSIVGTLHSYCMAGYECKMQKILSPSNCVNCENVVIDEEKALNWKKRHQWISDMIIKMKNNGELTHSMYSHFITQIRAAEQVLDYFKIPYQTLNIIL